MTQLEALKEIARRNNGLLRPQAVVDAARDEDSPLHGAFEWDDSEAARLYRLDQAQRLIRSFKIEIKSKNETISVPVFIGVSSDRTGGRANNPYRITEDVIKTPDLMEIAVRDALEQLESVRNRYAHLTELKEVWGAIDNHLAHKRKGAA